MPQPPRRPQGSLGPSALHPAEPCRSGLGAPGAAGAFFGKQPLLSFFTRSVVNALGTWVASLLLRPGRASRPVVLPCLAFSVVPLRVDSSKILSLQQKEQLGKPLHRREGVSSRACS